MFRAHGTASRPLGGRAAAAIVAQVLFLAVVAVPASAQEPPVEGSGADDPAAPMLVTFTSGARLEVVDDAAPAGVDLEPLTDRVAAAALTTAEAAILARQPGVVAVEPDRVVFAADVPDDPCLVNPTSCPPVGAWHVDATELPAAWDVSHGLGVLVAIVDGGIDENTPDLSGKVVGELDMTGGGPECPDHGTQGAVLAGAATGNGLRVPGTGWDAQVLSVQALSLAGGRCTGFESAVIQAVDSAVAAGARVVNLSLTITSLSAALRSAIDRTIAAGVVVVAAAGNSGSTNPAVGFGGYPAAYAPVLAVGATTQAGGLAGFSNRGPWVDVYAPGDRLQDTLSSSVPCTLPPGDCTISGTSFASPITAGVVALMLSARPSLRPADVELLLRRTANVGPGGIARLDARDGLYDTAFRGNLPTGAGTAGIGSGRVHVATQATDGSVWHRTLGDRWSQAGGTIVGDPDLASASPGRVVVVARGGDGGAWMRRLDVGSPWQPVGGGRFSSSLSVVATGSDRLEIFGRGLDGALWHGTVEGGTFEGWQPLGGALASEPDAAALPDGRVMVFAAGVDGALWTRTFDGVRWLPWATLGGRLTLGPGSVSWGGSRVDVVVRGTDGAVYHRGWDGTAWSGWLGLGGLISTAPDLATRGPGTLDVIARAGDHHLWRLPFEAGGWQTWQPAE